MVNKGVQYGKMVTTLKYVGKPPNVNTRDIDCWLTDTSIVWAFDGFGDHKLPFVPDRMLTPIEPDDSDDETFQWAGKPKEIVNV